jgi:hypothetical protein
MRKLRFKEISHENKALFIETLNAYREEGSWRVVSIYQRKKGTEFVAWLERVR